MIDDLQWLVKDLSERLSNRVVARWIVDAVSGSEDTYSSSLSPKVRADEIAQRYLAGEPLQYLLGKWSFRNLELKVDNRALIPRPETEQLVGVALDLLSRESVGDAGSVVVADLGTGSGAIALSIAVEESNCVVLATDLSPESISLARENLSKMSESVISRVSLHLGSWFEALPPSYLRRLAMVVSNPPYISESEYSQLSSTVRDHEPCSALLGGPTGTEALALIITEASSWLRPKGWLVLELAPSQAGDMAKLMAEVGYTDIEVILDLSERERILRGRTS